MTPCCFSCDSAEAPGAGWRTCPLWCLCWTATNAPWPWRRPPGPCPGWSPSTCDSASAIGQVQKPRAHILKTVTTSVVEPWRWVQRGTTFYVHFEELGGTFAMIMLQWIIFSSFANSVKNFGKSFAKLYPSLIAHKTRYLKPEISHKRKMI